MEKSMNRGDRLRNLRKQAKLGQGALAQQLGIDTSLISRFENGEREPSSQQILALARAFGVSIDYLLNADAQPRFILRGSKAGDGDESDEIHKVIVDAEQQVHYLHTAYSMANTAPRRSCAGLS